MRCAYCHGEATLQGTRPCAGCGVRLHAACWVDVPQCPTLGCALPAPREAERGPSPGPGRWVVGLLAGCVSSAGVSLVFTLVAMQGFRLFDGPGKLDPALGLAVLLACLVHAVLVPATWLPARWTRGADGLGSTFLERARAIAIAQLVVVLPIAAALAAVVANDHMTRDFLPALLGLVALPVGPVVAARLALGGLDVAASGRRRDLDEMRALGGADRRRVAGVPAEPGALAPASLPEGESPRGGAVRSQDGG